MNNKVKLHAVGTDAEFFLKDKKNNEIISAEGFIVGSKWDPFFFDPNDRYSSTQLDNVLAEITMIPAKSAKEFVRNVNKSIAYVRSILPEHIDVVALPSANLDPKYLQTEQAILFGCQSDYNAYTLSVNSKPFAEDPTLRSAG